MIGPREGLDGPDLARLEPELAAARAPSASSRRVAQPLYATSVPPCDEQRRGVLGQDVERRDRADGDDVDSAHPVAPLLGPRADDLDVAQPDLLDRALEERALAPEALDERDLRAGERGREDEAGEAGAGAEVGDPAGGAHDVELERASESARCAFTATLRLADGRRRGLVLGTTEESLERAGTGRRSAAQRGEGRLGTVQRR